MDFSSNWNSEKQSAYLYRVIAEKETHPERKRLFARLSEEAENQAAIWEGKLTPGLCPTHFSVPWRLWLIAGLVRTLGPRPVRPILAAMKVRGLSIYKNPLAFHSMPEEIGQVGSRHQMGAGNWLRATVFGANDGLVSNASLILGVAGASLDQKEILLSGVAGMLAGAFSMACGEFVSVKSQREFFEKQIALEKEELESYPEEEAAELALIFEARGLNKEEAERNAKTLISDPTKALQTLAREELGVNPEELGSPGVAAFSSFLSFLIGAALPLVPFLLTTSRPVEWSIGVSSSALFIMGCVLSLFTGRSALWSGVRMLFLGAIAGSCTFFLGHWLGVRLSG